MKDLWTKNIFILLVSILNRKLNGGNLLDRLSSSQIREDLAAKITGQILSGLAHCHAKNIAHRDLKLENIMFYNNEANSDIKIIDFGFARIFDTKKGFDDILGTPIYMAPEILGNKSYGIECDIWSLGVLIYFLLSGEFPFKPNGMRGIMKQIRNTEFQPKNLKSKKWEIISDEAKDFVCCMLKVNLKERWTASQLLNHNWIKNYTEMPGKLSTINIIENVINFKVV